MPTYVYRRDDGTTFETFQRITDDALTKDPATGQKVMRVISGGAGLQFKGTGFYLTDYGRAGSDLTATNGKNEKAEAASDEKSESKTDAKSETKVESTPGSTAKPKADAKPEAKNSKTSGGTSE